MAQPKPALLVDPGWLQTRLGDPKVRIFDCTMVRVPQPSGASIWESGKDNWHQAHIPGAGFLNMVEELSAPSGSVPYGLPKPETVAALLSSHGIASDATLVLYGDGGQSVVHRVWWVLTASGVADVRVLDGGWKRWRGENRPVESGEPVFAATDFVGSPRPEILIERDAVAEAVGDPSKCLIHSLTFEQFCGTGGQVYGKPGRIPGSVSVPAASLIDPDTMRFHPLEKLAEIFSSVGADEAETIISYCGGGIAASTVFLALALVGYDNVRLYDGSLIDWAADPSLPMVSDAETI
jgi:thiosulfate/3-mercaptopyruvate sulfurtransferase